MAITDKLKTTPPPLICLGALVISLASNAIWSFALIPGHCYVAGSLLIFGHPYQISTHEYTTPFIGLGVLLSNLWMLIWLLPATVIIDRYVIPEEERRLEQAFAFGGQ